MDKLDCINRLLFLPFVVHTAAYGATCMVFYHSVDVSGACQNTLSMGLLSQDQLPFKGNFLRSICI